MAVQKGWGKNLGASKPVVTGPDAADVVGQLFSELVGTQPAEDFSLPGNCVPGDAEFEAALAESLRQLSESTSPLSEPSFLAGPPDAAALETPSRSEPEPMEGPRIPEVTLDPNILSMLGEESETGVPAATPMAAAEAGETWLHSESELVASVGFEAPPSDAVLDEAPAQAATPLPAEVVASDSIPEGPVAAPASVVDEAAAGDTVEHSATAQDTTAHEIVTDPPVLHENVERESIVHETAVHEIVARDSLADEDDRNFARRDVAMPQIRRPHTAVPAHTDEHDETGSGELDHVIQSIDAQVARTPFVINFGRTNAERESKNRTTTPWIVFSLAGTRYAVPIHQVTETDVIPPITPVPYTPAFVRGVANLRGEIIAVLDLRSLLGLEHTGRFERGRMLVVRVGEQHTTAAMVVDEVRGIDRFAESDLTQMAGPINDKVATLLRGTFEHEGRVLNVLDLEKLFQSADVRQLTAA